MMQIYGAPPSAPQAGFGGEEHIFIIPAHWWTPATIYFMVMLLVVMFFILITRWNRRDKAIISSLAILFFGLCLFHTVQRAGQMHVQFRQDYRAPIYWVWDLTDEKAIVKLYDKTYAHASDIIVEAPKGHNIRLKVAGR